MNIEGEVKLGVLFLTFCSEKVPFYYMFRMLPSVSKIIPVNHYKVTFFSARTYPQIFPLPTPSKACALPFDFALERDRKNIFYYQCNVKNYMGQVPNFQVGHPPLYVTFSICLSGRAPCLTKCTSSDHNFWYTYKIISLGVFFI